MPKAVLVKDCPPRLPQVDMFMRICMRSSYFWAESLGTKPVANLWTMRLLFARRITYRRLISVQAQLALLDIVLTHDVTRIWSSYQRPWRRVTFIQSLKASRTVAPVKSDHSLAFSSA